MNNQATTIKADTASLLGALFILSDLLHSGNFPLQFLDGVLNLVDSPGKLSRITTITTVGTGITIRFEQTDILLAHVAALRTGNLDSFFLEHGKLALAPLDVHANCVKLLPIVKTMRTLTVILGIVAVLALAAFAAKGHPPGFRQLRHWKLPSFGVSIKNPAEANQGGLIQNAP